MTKVFGIGLSRTGTKTLGQCLRALGLGRVRSFNVYMTRRWERDRDAQALVDSAVHGDGFEDEPWYYVWPELDRAFPGSKFVLTVRRDAETYARSHWHHLVDLGYFDGPPPRDALDQVAAYYEAHNRAVQDAFAARPEQLLVTCWERGDGWGPLCDFLGRPVPATPFPHENRGRYQPGPVRALASRLGLRKAQIDTFFWSRTITDWGLHQWRMARALRGHAAEEVQAARAIARPLPPLCYRCDPPSVRR